MLRANIGVRPFAFRSLFRGWRIERKIRCAYHEKNYVFVFCYFLKDDIYYFKFVFAHAVCMGCGAGDDGLITNGCGYGKCNAKKMY